MANFWWIVGSTLKNSLPKRDSDAWVNLQFLQDMINFHHNLGTVIRTSLAKLLEYERDYICNKCKHTFTLNAKFAEYFTMRGPSGCPSDDGCTSIKFTCLSDRGAASNFKDYQEIKIQEQVQKLSIGTIPRTMSVVLEDDLVDSCKPGDDVTVYGVVLRRWKPIFSDVSLIWNHLQYWEAIF